MGPSAVVGLTALGVLVCRAAIDPTGCQPTGRQGWVPVQLAVWPGGSWAGADLLVSPMLIG